MPSIAMPFEGVLRVCRVVHPFPTIISSGGTAEADPKTKCTVYHLRSNEFWKKHVRTSTHLRRYILIYKITSPVVIMILHMVLQIHDADIRDSNDTFILVATQCLSIMTIWQKQNTTDSLAAALLLCLDMARIHPAVACSLIHFMLKYALKLAHWWRLNLMYPPELDILINFSLTCLDELRSTNNLSRMIFKI